MVARTWTGTVRRADAEDYAGYIRDTGFTEYYEVVGEVSREP